jgi:hypothetical protein
MLDIRHVNWNLPELAGRVSFRIFARRVFFPLGNDPKKWQRREPCTDDWRSS